MAFASPNNVGHLGSYYPMEDAYSIHRLLNSFRVTPDNPNGYTYQTQASIVDEEGNEYKFQHSHHDNHLQGRPLPWSRDDCPRPESEISKVTGECLDRCQSNIDCPLSYSCMPSQKDGKARCFPQQCTNNSQCPNGCENGVCRPVFCGEADAERYPQNRCLSTSHYYLQGRSGLAPFDQRYKNLY